MVSTENEEEKPLNWRETRMIELLGEGSKASGA